MSNAPELTILASATLFAHGALPHRRAGVTITDTAVASEFVAAPIAASDAGLTRLISLQLA